MRKMTSVSRWLCVAAFLVPAVLAVCAARAGDQTGQGALAAYIAAPDPSFAWREVKSGHVDSTTDYVEVVMTSQTWRNVAWKHQLFVLRPANIHNGSRQALLFVHSGRWKDEYETQPRSELPREARLFAKLAREIGAPVAVLRQVPFQPLFDLREDALIAYTFDRYLETGESDWPLLLPMVKSTVRAMDVIQQVAGERWQMPIDSFTVAGASKRGWTTWLTAAADSRVAAVAPMVIDVLNMPAQMDHQRETWGELSEQIHDYQNRDLPQRLRSPRGRELMQIVDPFSYRDRLTRPKFILLSTNDRYWPLDALKLYWGELPEEKRVLYVPNQGHSLRDINRVIGALSALHRYARDNKPMPKLTWNSRAGSQDLTITVSSDRPVRDVRVWSAHSDTRDFRSARWQSRRCALTHGEYVCRSSRGKQGYSAAFAEAVYRDDGALPFSQSTMVCLAGPPSASANSEC